MRCLDAYGVHCQPGLTEEETGCAPRDRTRLHVLPQAGVRD
jgi:hypothetical protein